MDGGDSATIYTKLRRYWRRRSYQRINDFSRRRGKPIELGSSNSTTTGRRPRFWRRIKIKPKLKVFKTASPKKFLVWLRDAYVKMMLGFANSRVVGPGYGDHPGFGRGPIKEYDEKMIIQIYKSIVMAQGQIVPGDASRFAAANRLTAIVE